jgi:hypothetical protein
MVAIKVDINYPEDRPNQAKEIETSLMQKPERAPIFPTTFRALCEDVFVTNHADDKNEFTMNPEERMMAMESANDDEE